MHVYTLIAALMPLLVVRTLAQESPQRGPPRGTVVKQSTTHGTYFEYAPKAAPTHILVVVHGMLDEEQREHNAERFIKRWTELAEQKRLLLLAPYFDQENFGGVEGPGGGYRGLFGRQIGADEFLDKIIAAARRQFPSLAEKFYLYGHSAGGQFANRYLVKYPQRIEAAVISTAGTYAFPDPNVPWPNGMGQLQRTMRWSKTDPRQKIDIRPDPAGWLAAAQLQLTVVVGEEDTAERDVSGNPGKSNLQRGENWVQAMNEYARRHDAKGTLRFRRIPGVGHSSAALTPACREALWPD